MRLQLGLSATVFYLSWPVFEFVCEAVLLPLAGWRFWPGPFIQ